MSGLQCYKEVLCFDELAASAKAASKNARRMNQSDLDKLVEAAGVFLKLNAKIAEESEADING